MSTQYQGVSPCMIDIYRTPEFSRFLFFGAIAALTTLGTSWLLYGARLLPDLPYWCATGVGATAGLIVNFVLNYLFNFRYHQRSIAQQFVTFFLVAWFGVVLTSGISEMCLLLLSAIGIDKIGTGHLLFDKNLMANVTAVALVALYSFPAHKFISFNVGLNARMSQLRALTVGGEDR